MSYKSLPGFVKHLRFHKRGAKMTKMISIPPLKSLAHNKYQVAGRQLCFYWPLLPFIIPNQTKTIYCCHKCFAEVFLLKHWFSWMECKFDLRQNSELVICSDDRFQKDCSGWFSETLFLSNNSMSLTI